VISEVAVARVDIASEDSINREVGNAMTEFDPNVPVADGKYRATESRIGHLRQSLAKSVK
jgi:hypothetical protein